MRPTRVIVIPRRWLLLLPVTFLILTARFALGHFAWPDRDGPIIIDAGHGGIDGGANVPGILEKTINLEMALGLGDFLSRKGLPVVLTRETDRDLSEFGPQIKNRHRADLTGRVNRAHDEAGLFLVSLHVNSSRDPSERGSMIFYQSHSSESLRLATLIHKALKDVNPAGCDRPIGGDTLFVIRNTRVPTVLVEIGFLSNAEDRTLMIDEEYRAKLTAALGTAIEEYYLSLTQRPEEPAAVRVVPGQSAPVAVQSVPMAVQGMPVAVRATQPGPEYSRMRGQKADW
jgi:N-acetylmuramoyl-L-alanine amidase